METVFELVKKCCIFLLGVTVLSSLAGDAGYKKYFDYAAGILLIAMMASPILSLLGAEDDFMGGLRLSSFEAQSEEIREEVERFGKDCEEEAWAQYEERIEEEVAAQCGVRKEDCHATIRDGAVKKLEITLPEEKVFTEEERKQLALRYGMEEEGIFRITGENG